LASYGVTTSQISSRNKSNCCAKNPGFPGTWVPGPGELPRAAPLELGNNTARARPGPVHLGPVHLAPAGASLGDVAWPGSPPAAGSLPARFSRAGWIGALARVGSLLGHPG